MQKLNRYEEALETLNKAKEINDGIKIVKNYYNDVLKEFKYPTIISNWVKTQFLLTNRGWVKDLTSLVSRFAEEVMFQVRDF